MQVSNVKAVMAGIAAATVLIAITGAASGTGIGAVFNLGRVNTVNATSSLTGTTRPTMLSVTNSGTGSALALHVAKGKAPFSVNSSTQVSNLNASLLGGLANTQFVQGGGHWHAFGFTMNTASASPATLLSIPGYGKLLASCGTFEGGFAEVNYLNGAEQVDRFEIALTPTGQTIGDLTVPANSEISVASSATGVQNGQWTQMMLRYATVTGFLVAQHVATVDVLVTINGSTCDFDASTNAGPGFLTP